MAGTNIVVYGNAVPYCEACFQSTASGSRRLRSGNSHPVRCREQRLLHASDFTISLLEYTVAHTKAQLQEWASRFELSFIAISRLLSRKPYFVLLIEPCGVSFQLLFTELSLMNSTAATAPPKGCRGYHLVADRTSLITYSCFRSCCSDRRKIARKPPRKIALQ